jgi:chromosomal replication initiator protein
VTTKMNEDLDLFTATNNNINIDNLTNVNLIDENAAGQWKRCLQIVKDNVNSQVYRTWFEPIKAIKLQNNQLTILVPSQFFYEWIEEHFYGLLKETVIKVLGTDAKLQYQVVVEESMDNLENRTIKVPAFRYPPSGANITLPFIQSPVQKQEFPTFLNPRYSFSNFITGECNQLATAAAKAVSQNPGGTRFNPLFIYGATGLGKTHLIQAIGNQIHQANPRKRVLYTSSDCFTMEYINAVQNNKTNEFTNFYRSIDVLIVDDIQFFSGKEKTQDNFFHTFNALHQAGKQLVLSSDRPPKELKDIDDRLISRFQWGLTADIQHPDLEMRMAILQKKSSDEGIELTTETVEYLARYIKSNIRELEGILISLIAKMTLDRRELNLDLVKEIVHGTAKLDEKPLTIDKIKDYVSAFFNIAIENLESKSRKHEIALARQMAMYLAKQYTELSLKSIGSFFGNRDHSTVLHSCTTIENYLCTDKTVKSAFESLKTQIMRD